jgi:hypothetical protein
VTVPLLSPFLNHFKRGDYHENDYSNYQAFQIG